MAHEHIFVDNWVVTSDYNFILDNEDLATQEVQRYRDDGGGSICETTSQGLGRNPAGLARVSAQTGVHILMGSGWYREAVYPPSFDSTSTNRLAADLVEELVIGVGPESIRPGFIGEIGTERGAISPRQERMFRAAARAHAITGCPIVTHTTHWGELGLEQVSLLAEEGVSHESIIVGHLGDRYRDEVVTEIAKTGAWLSVDNLGFVEGYAPLDVRADNVTRLWDLGHGSQILLSSDLCGLSQMSAYGGPGYANVLERFVPLLLARGLGEADVSTMLVDNPARAFSYVPRLQETLDKDGIIEAVVDAVSAARAK